MAIESNYQVYIFDNSPKESTVREFCKNKKEIRYFTVGKNLGLGLGIASVCAQAFYENKSALIFFDQDTIFNKDTLECVENYNSQHPELATTHSAIVFKAKKSEEKNNEACFKNVSLAINSGSLFYLKNLKKINWHSEKYFVDGVDYEFCLRSKINNFLIGQYSCTPGFDHVTEQADKNYKIFGKIYVMRAYPLSRVTDVSISSIRLIFTALASGEIKFSLNIGKLLLIYIASQICARFFNAAGEEKV
ncbi:rhamnosyltransferase [Collimonas sp. PA-H2]|nr:rhamnosyltransferase [Collimonas sp. PA-H2]